MNNTVPEGWQVKKLGSLVDPRSSNVDKKTSPDEIPVQLCNYTDVYYRNRITSDIDFMEASAKQREIDRFSLEKGDVIITKDSETPDDIAVPAYVSEDLNGVVCGYHLTLLKPYKTKSDGEFLSHLFQLPSMQHYFYVLANGITRFGLTADTISEAPLLAPPLPEQQKIATILSSVDDVIEKTRAQIDKLKDLKTGMMQELLTKGIGSGGVPHTEFKDSPVGRIPVGWEVNRISDICSEIVDCVNKTAPIVDYVTPYRMIRTTNVRDGRIIEDGMRYVTKDTFETWSRRLSLQNGDLIFTREAPVGECGLIRDARGLFLGQRTMVYRAEPKKVDKLFLLLSMQSEYFKSQLDDLSGGSTTPHLRVPDCSKILIKTPPLQEQQKISIAIQSVEQVAEEKRNTLERFESIKKALMQDLLTGKRRVKFDKKELMYAE